MTDPIMPDDIARPRLLTFPIRQGLNGPHFAVVGGNGETWTHSESYDSAGNAQRALRDYKERMLRTLLAEAGVAEQSIETLCARLVDPDVATVVGSDQLRRLNPQSAAGRLIDELSEIGFEDAVQVLLAPTAVGEELPEPDRRVVTALDVLFTAISNGEL